MSVRKRKWTTAKGEKKQSWVVDYVDANGKRHLITKDTKKEADEEQAKVRVEVKQGTHVADSETITIAEAGALWLKSGARLERTTLDQRKQHLNLHITPLVGDTKLSKVTVPFIRNFQDLLREGGRSEAMVKRVTVSLGSILADAQSRGLAMLNAVHALSRSRAGKEDDSRQKAPLRYGVDIPTNDEIRAILNAADGRWRPLIVTAIFTGMRASELRGLRWEDVDLEKGSVQVSQRADRYNDIGSPKSQKGYRTIPLAPLATNTLRTWQKECPQSEKGLVFPNGAGNVEAHPNIVSRGLWPTMLRAGVSVAKRDASGAILLGEDGVPVMVAKYPGLHALRHWFASWCINRKADGGLELTAKAVQERMGHGSIVMTMDVYGHLFPSADEAKALAEAEVMLMAANAT